MTMIHGSSEHMREFARQLTQFSVDTHDRLSNLKSRLISMGTAEWTDENYRKFLADYEPTEQDFLRALAGLDSELIPYLEAMADRYEALE